MSKPLAISNELIKGARDRMRADPNPVFAKRIQDPIFEFSCRDNFTPLIVAHRVWLRADSQLVEARHEQIRRGQKLLQEGVAKRSTA